MGWTEHVACMGKATNVYILIGYLCLKSPQTADARATANIPPRLSS